MLIENIKTGFKPVFYYNIDKSFNAAKDRKLIKKIV